jgi:hypothetical protein
MEPISVPAPSKSAFNKNRRVSDLLLHQLKHFQHVERKNGIQIDPALSRDIYTEAGAARYITEITRAIKAQSQALAPAQGQAQAQSEAKPAGIAGVPGKRKQPATPKAGLAIAAAEDPTAKPRKRKKP